MLPCLSAHSNLKSHFPSCNSSFPPLVSSQAAHTRALVTLEPAPLPVGSAEWDGAGQGHGKSVSSTLLFCFHDPIRFDLMSLVLLNTKP